MQGGLGALTRGLRGVPRALAAQQAALRTCLSKEHMESSTWTGAGTQEDFMQRDECLVVDEHDTLLRTANKHACHRFNQPDQPVAPLHRAFSVFLFRPEDNRLLLQQRAAAKVTFPSVWTNTCCSHPLAGQQPDEVDGPQQVADGSVPGVRAAAVRKLAHELGMDPAVLRPLLGDPRVCRFVTRLHYCAADSDTWGPAAEWGEHEVDYILLLRPPPGEVERMGLLPNPEEVDAVKWVSPSELQSMMEPSTGLRWSPWFRIIATQPAFLPTWWSDLDAVLAEGKHADTATIHHIL